MENTDSWGLETEEAIYNVYWWYMVEVMKDYDLKDSLDSIKKFSV